MIDSRSPMSCGVSCGTAPPLLAPGEVAPAGPPGFGSIAIAPAATRCCTTTSSAWAVTKTVGIRRPRAPNCCFTSRPLIPGITKSRSRHVTNPSSRDWRNSSPDAKVRTRNANVPRNLSSASRKDSSSSTIATTGASRTGASSRVTRCGLFRRDMLRLRAVAQRNYAETPGLGSSRSRVTELDGPSSVEIRRWYGDAGAEGQEDQAFPRPSVTSPGPQHRTIDLREDLPWDSRVANALTVLPAPHARSERAPRGPQVFAGRQAPLSQTRAVPGSHLGGP
jgi:hypothetical protein